MFRRNKQPLRLVIIPQSFGIRGEDAYLLEGEMKEKGYPCIIIFADRPGGIEIIKLV